MQVDYNKLKLIVWDLDDTFWEGTISEEEVSPCLRNIELIQTTVNLGIMNSICSKNDYDQVKNMLIKMNIWDLFVFPSIEWTPKGPRIKQQLERMKLRAENVLFIDDNDFNLNEVTYSCPNIMTLNANEIGTLYDFFDAPTKFKLDKEHNRLKQYKILEEKEHALSKASSNHDFLVNSNICVFIDKTCKDIERIAELVQRTNQLNYTKRRVDVDELNQEIHNDNNYSGCIYVKDRFGEYGCVGFFSLDKGKNKLNHFLFSCRTMGMGIEQYVYEKLNFPDLKVVGSVASEVKPEHIVDWITEVTTPSVFSGRKDSCQQGDSITRGGKILFKGPCDLLAILPLITGVSIDTEFNFINERNFTVAGFNHSVHIMETLQFSESKIMEILEDVPFMDRADFKTNMFSDEYKMVFYSLLPDLHQGVYQHKKKGYRISFNSGNYSLTDKTKWEKYINGDYENSFNFTEELLEKFSDSFKFEGFLSIEEILYNILWIRERMPLNTMLVLLTGSEIESEINTEEFYDHAPRHKALNKLLSETFDNVNNVKVVNPTKYITSQDSFNGCTNHYSKQVYYLMAQEITGLINESLIQNRKVKALRHGSWGFYMSKIKRKIQKYFFPV